MIGNNVMRKKAMIVAMIVVVIVVICFVFVECPDNVKNNSDTTSTQGEDYPNEDMDQTDTTGEINNATITEREEPNEQLSDEEKASENASDGSTISSQIQSDLNEIEQGIVLPDHEWK